MSAFSYTGLTKQSYILYDACTAGGGPAAAGASLGAAPMETPTEAPTLLLTQLTMLHHQTPEQSPESRERLLLLHRDLRRNPWGAPLPEGAVMWDCDPAPATEEDLLKVTDAVRNQTLRDDSVSGLVQLVSCVSRTASSN
jgi:hypothetical protein